jgi:iron complex outermembrane receptor protein
MNRPFRSTPRPRAKRSAIAIPLAFPLLWATSALAQTEASTAPLQPPAVVTQQSGLQEVVITAERQSKSLQKTAITVSAISGDDLIKTGVTNVKDLVNSMPSLSVTSAAPSANLSLLGVAGGGSSPAYSDPTVAFNVGGVPIARQFSTTAAFYDLERVEVLKGPQGTLYGRNSVVGAVNLIPAAPTFKREGAASIQIGNYSTANATGMINLPLGDTLAARIALTRNKHDGYLSNGYNDANNYGARIGLLYKPNQDFSVLLRADTFRDRSRGSNVVYLFPNGAAGGRWANPDNPWQAYLPAGCGTPALCPTYASTSGTRVIAPFTNESVVGADGYQHIRQNIYSAELNWKFDAVTLTVIPAYVDTDVAYRNYSSGFRQELTDIIRQSSLEGRLSGKSGALTWLVGAFGFREHQDATNTVFGNGQGGQVSRTPNLVDKSVALFGDATYALSRQWRLSAGLRRTREDKSQDGYLANPGPSSNCPAPAFVYGPDALAPVGGCTIPNGGSLRFTDTSYKVGMEYDIAPRSMLYATVRTGFKAGGLNPGFAPNTYKPEKLKAYEIGAKNRFFDNRLQLNASAFYWDYKDQQVVTVGPLNPVGQTGIPFNVPGWIRGIDLSADWRPTPVDRFNIDLTAADGEYKVYPATGTSSAGFTVAHTDWPRTNLPGVSGNASYQRTFVLNSGDLDARIKTHFESGTWLQVDHLPGSYRDRFALVDLNLTWTPSSSDWSVTAYVDNVADKAVFYGGTNGQVSRGVLYRPAGNANALTASLGAPRTYGLRVSTHF